MTHPYALYYLVEEDGRTRQVVNGVVTSLSNRKPLSNAPIGSNDILIQWVRNITRYAQVRSVSLPMGFVREAALILRNDRYKFNIDRALSLLIQRFVSDIDDNFYYDRYHFLYKGELDFSTAEDDQAGSRFNINILEGGLSKLVKANEGTEYEILFDDDAVNIQMDGIKITGVYRWTIIEHTTGATGALPTMVLVGEEQKAPGIAVFNVNGGYTFSYGGINADSTEYFTTSTIPPEGGIAHFEGTINMSAPDPSFPANIYVHIYNVITDTTTRYDLFTGPEADTITINKDINIVQGDRLFLEIDEYINESNLSFTIKTRHPATTIKAFRLIDLLKKICLKMGIDQTKVISNELETSNLMITSGDGIRGISGAGVKAKFNDWFKAADTYHFLGMSVRDTINVEDRLSFFNPASPTQLGACSEFKSDVVKELSGFSSIKAGHKPQDIEDVNGKYDFNGETLFTTPQLKGGAKQYDLTSPWKAGPYEIESIRANLDGKTTTDDTRDGEPFAIACAPTTTIFETLASFLNAGTIMIVPLDVKVFAGQLITVVGSALGNDRMYRILAVTSTFVGNFVQLDSALVDEPNVNIALTILKGAVYNLDRSINVTSGVPDPDTIFNVPLSPARILEKHKRWLASIFYNYTGQLVFQQTTKKGDLGYLIAEGLNEGASRDISSLGAIIFKPYEISFKVGTNVDIAGIMETAPETPFATDWMGSNFPGFSLDVGIAPNSLTPQVFRLLATPDFDELNLIR
jgi:hypothetical protein